MDMNIVRKLFIRRQSITLENQKATTAGSGKETAGSLEPGLHQVWSVTGSALRKQRHSQPRSTLLTTERRLPAARHCKPVGLSYKHDVFQLFQPSGASARTAILPSALSLLNWEFRDAEEWHQDRDFTASRKLRGKGLLKAPSRTHTARKSWTFFLPLSGDESSSPQRAAACTISNQTPPRNFE